MNETLALRVQALSDALIDGDSTAAATHRAWLMGEVAAGLLDQDSDTLMELRAAVADLAPLADHYGEGGPGERWRAVWELLYAIGQTTRPLEQARLARAETVPGQLLRLIRDEPGISPGDMAKRLDKRANHVSNALRALIDQGLAFRLPRGREVNYYLSETGREAVADEAPAQLAAAEAPESIERHGAHGAPYASAQMAVSEAPAAMPALAPSPSAALTPADSLPYVGAERMSRPENPCALPGAGARRTRSARRLRGSARPALPGPSARREPFAL